MAELKSKKVIRLSREGLFDIFKSKEEEPKKQSLKDISVLYLYTHFYSKENFQELVNFFKTYETLTMPIVNKYKNMDPGKQEFTNMYKEVKQVLPKLKAKSVSLRNKTIAACSKVLNVPKSEWIYGVNFGYNKSINDVIYCVIKEYDDGTMRFDENYDTEPKELSDNDKIKLLQEALSKCKNLIHPENHPDILPKSFSKLVNDFEEDKFNDSFGEDCVAELYYDLIDQGRYPHDNSTSTWNIEHDIRKHLEELTGDKYF